MRGGTLPPAAETLEMTLEAVEKSNPAGVVHGGITATLLEWCFDATLNLNGH